MTLLQYTYCTWAEIALEVDCFTVPNKMFLGNWDFMPSSQSTQCGQVCVWIHVYNLKRTTWHLLKEFVRPVCWTNILAKKSRPTGCPESLWNWFRLSGRPLPSFWAFVFMKPGSPAFLSPALELSASRCPKHGPSPYFQIQT